jgi:AraC-like DNA-binding protein
VNNFRINEARRLIASNPDITVIELMEKTGFGSRQSFNRNFKTATGFTPSGVLAKGQRYSGIER